VIDQIKNRLGIKNKRDTRLVLSMITGMLTKVFSVGSALITIPITLKYLGTEEFGLWMLITGILGVLSFSDLGIGMGLQNAISKCVGKDDKTTPQKYISTSYFLISVISTVIFILLFIAYQIIPLGFLFNNETINGKESMLFVIFISISIFLLGMPIGLIQRVLNGYQKMYISNNLLLGGQILALISIFISVWLDLKIIGLVSLFLLSPIVIFLFYSIYYYSINSLLVPHYKKVTKDCVTTILNTGIWTVVTQLIYTLKVNAPIMIISITIGLSALTEFSIIHKFVSIISVIVNIALQSLWPVYGEAFARGDKKWIVKTMKKSLIGTSILSFLALFFVFTFNDFIFSFWVGDDFSVDNSLLIGLSVMAILINLNVCFAVFLNGTGHFKRQSQFSMLFVSLAIGFAYLLAPVYGVIGIVLSMTIIAEMFRLPIFYLITKRVVNQL
jgi:O-antigen/teichoic acid export membrane protein